MPNRQQVIESLQEVIIPSTQRSIVDANLVLGIDISGEDVRLRIASTGLLEEEHEWIADHIKAALKEIAETGTVEVGFLETRASNLNSIDKVIVVMSGKGGVGKSLVSGLAAVSLRRQGASVGILDGDITGPSIPRMFGVKGQPHGSESGFLPLASKSGIQIMSINLLLSEEGDAVIWRGPLIARAVTQFWEDVVWGKLDYLVVDLPPGTADAPLTILQQLPVSGIIIVFTPQDLTAMIVKKAVNMANQMQKPILGVVENMSYLFVPELGKKIEIFGKSHGEEMAEVAGAPLLGQLPIDPELAKLCDEGKIEDYQSDLVTRLGASISQLLQKQQK